MVKLFLNAKEVRTIFTGGEEGRKAGTGGCPGEERSISNAPKMGLGSQAHCIYLWFITPHEGSYEASVLLPGPKDMHTKTL